MLTILTGQAKTLYTHGTSPTYLIPRLFEAQAFTGQTPFQQHQSTEQIQQNCNFLKLHSTLCEWGKIEESHKSS